MNLSIQEILPDLYRAEIPLPDSPLKATNSYVIRGEGRSLIIDTGLNEDVCLDAMNGVIEKLSINLSKTDFFITHAHIDHIGLVSVLASQSSRVYFNKPESDQDASSSLKWAEASSRFARRHGYLDNRILQMVTNVTTSQKYAVYPKITKYTFLKENDPLDIGDYSFRVIETPGHSRGHMCLYDKNKKIFISGDHILGDITPNIASRFNNDENPLAEYLASLDKVFPLEVKLTLPGHRNPVTDFRGRISELKSHHAERAAETLEILKDGSLDAFQVASRMTWDMVFNKWEEVAFFPKWFAFGEALSHLQYLESLGKVRQIPGRDGKILFCLAE